MLQDIPIPPHPLPTGVFVAPAPTPMSNRDQIACMAMQGFMAAPNPYSMSDDGIARIAYRMADAMIKEGKIQV